MPHETTKQSSGTVIRIVNAVNVYLIEVDARRWALFDLAFTLAREDPRDQAASDQHARAGYVAEEVARLMQCLDGAPRLELVESID